MRMRRWLGCILCLLLFSLAGCGSDAIVGEDWDQFAEVYSGAGPEEDFEHLYMKFNYAEGSQIVGEWEGTFFSKFQGEIFTRLEQTRIVVESTLRSEQCLGLTRIDFEGQIQDDRITGVLSYSGCEVYEFFYEADRVGGVGR